MLNEIDASLQKLWIRNQKCDNTDEEDDDGADGDMIPMCDTKNPPFTAKMATPKG